MRRRGKRSEGRRAEAMTAAEAVVFGRWSDGNVALIKEQLPCECEPYTDVYTFNRWKAQGYRVQKGEHGIRIPIVQEREIEAEAEAGEEGGEAQRRVVKARHTAYVFCRCQVLAVCEEG